MFSANLEKDAPFRRRGPKIGTFFLSFLNGLTSLRRVPSPSWAWLAQPLLLFDHFPKDHAAFLQWLVRSEQGSLDCPCWAFSFPFIDLLFLDLAYPKKATPRRNNPPSNALRTKCFFMFSVRSFAWNSFPLFFSYSASLSPLHSWRSFPEDLIRCRRHSQLWFGSSIFWLYFTLPPCFWAKRTRVLRSLPISFFSTLVFYSP